MRNETFKLALVLSLMVGTTAPAVAQRPYGGAIPFALQGPEGALRMRDRLELTDQQIQQLRALRDEQVEARHETMGRVMQQRALLLSGDMTREEWRESVAARRDDRISHREEQRERLHGILSDAQRNQLEQARREFTVRRMRTARRRGRMGPRSFAGVRQFRHRGSFRHSGRRLRMDRRFGPRF
ncbi:MAG: Spy/CpxP family protein refolding chaperone [Gemmatimonadales bacterium]